MQKYIPQQYFFIQCTLLYVSTSVCHPQGVLHLCIAKLHKFLKLKLLKLQFHKTIRLKSVIIIITSYRLMQGIYNCTSETNDVFSVYIVATIL